jgi:hypothetical protein
MIAQACHPIYLGVRDQEDEFKASLGKKLARSYLNKQDRCGGHTYNLSYLVVGNRKISVRS